MTRNVLVLILGVTLFIRIPSVSVQAFQAQPDPTRSYSAFMERIEQLAGFPKVTSGSREIRVLNWTPTAMIPMAALRLVHTGTGIEAQFIVAWHRDVSPSVRAPHSRTQCAPFAMCVEVHDTPFLSPPPGQQWMTLFNQLLMLEPCEDRTGAVTIASDAGDFVMEIFVNGQRREYFCNGVQNRQLTPSRLHAGEVFNYLQASMLQVLGR